MRSGLIKLLGLVFLSAMFSRLQAQDTVRVKDVFSVLLDADLKEDGVNLNGKPIVVVSNTNCRPCVEYFAKRADNYQLLFILFSESLLEVRNLLATYHLKPSEALFTACGYVMQKKQEVCGGPAPLILKPCGEFYQFYNYKASSELTKDFTLKQKKLKKRLGECE